MTDGGSRVTSGGEARARLVAWLVFAAIGGAFAIVNALSELDERARMGRPVDLWEPWCWELSSLVGWLVVAPLVFRAAQVHPPRFGWPATAGLHLLFSAAASLAHVGIMIGLRHAAYALLDDSYRSQPLGDVLVYEYRKDLISYAALVALPWAVRRLLAAGARPAPAPDGRRIEVRDGNRTVWLGPTDIEWAQAAGNYVELHGAFGMLLHRRTLAALEAELAPHGFRRIHRSRILRADAVRSVETRPSGDFEVVMASGARLAGSRRFRDRLA